MDWFRRLTGFAERDYDATRAKLRVDGRTLHSLVNGRSFGIGQLELASLRELREQTAGVDAGSGRLGVSNLSGDVRRLHGDSQFAGALFQVASQFNLLETVDPQVTPEDGVTGYARDHTQGPACAIAAGAATIYRNYFAPIAGAAGQTRARQLDGLSDLGAALGSSLGRPVDDLWSMTNGYALCTADGLAAIGAYLSSLSDDELDRLRGLLRVGLHRDVEVTDGQEGKGPTVSQAFCSALPVAYSRHERRLWEPFARLILEAAYEATLRAGVVATREGGSNTVVLTRLGGGAFGNDDRWIDDAIRRALSIVRHVDLDVVMLSYGPSPTSMVEIAEDFR